VGSPKQMGREVSCSSMEFSLLSSNGFSI
jgi:hypothetical protein